MGLCKRENSLFSRAKNLSKKKVFGQAILADDLLALRRLLVLKDTADFVVEGAHAVITSYRTGTFEKRASGPLVSITQQTVFLN